jgi:DNA-binding response OmpR family regulator
MPHRTPLQARVQVRPGGEGDERAPACPRLLVVEDDGATLDAICRLFRRKGWDVLPATTVAEGLALLAAGPAGAILDLHLPDGDGSLVLAAIREAGLPTRVVIATGSEDEAQIARVERMGPDLVLRKPVDVVAMMTALGAST